MRTIAVGSRVSPCHALVLLPRTANSFLILYWTVFQSQDTCHVEPSLKMGYQHVGFALAAILFLAIKYFNRTDVPKIKNIPEIPGVPIFGNLLQLGDEHARKAGAWAKQYGPVFQVRMGNRVILSWTQQASMTDETADLEDCLCQYLRKRETSLDSQPIRADFTPHHAHLPQGAQHLPGFYHWHLAVG